MLNKVLLIGNVGQDPEVRYLDGNNGNGGNAKVATIRLATSERYRDRNGEQRENTEWHSVVAWRNLADLAENFIKKGTQIYVEGKIRSREYTDQTGAKRYRTEIIADNIQLLGRRSDNPGAQDGGAPQGGFQGRQGGGYQGGGYQGGQQGGYSRPAPQGGYNGPQGGGYAPQGGYGPAAPQGGYNNAPARPEPANAAPVGDGFMNIPDGVDDEELPFN